MCQRRGLDCHEPSGLASTAASQAEACSITPTMPMECEETENTQPPAASPQATPSTSEHVPHPTRAPSDEPTFPLPSSSTASISVSAHGGDRLGNIRSAVAIGIRSIDFDDVYQNGAATEKHIIIHDPGTGGVVYSPL